MIMKKNINTSINAKVKFGTGDLIGDANNMFAKGEKALVKRARARGIRKFFDL